MLKALIRKWGILSFLLFETFAGTAQVGVQGRLTDEISGLGIPEGVVSVEGTSFVHPAGSGGSFTINYVISPGEYVLVFSAPGYLPKRFPVKMEEGQSRQLGEIPLKPDLSRDPYDPAILNLTSEELDRDEGGFDNVSGLLQATKDVFLNAAAFDFSSTFFRPRGLGSEYGSLLINGIEMSKFHNGRPQWSNWGGLNDVQRNQVFSSGVRPAENSFGGIAGTTDIIMRAGAYSEGGKVSVAASNRSYSGRVMASYNSGLNQFGWAYSVALSRRFAEESFVDGSIYDANSVFGALEKEISDSHSLNITAFFTPIRRGQTSANTMEVHRLKGSAYNSYWGYQEDEIRNSRMRVIEEPVFMLNHFWKIGGNTELSSSLAYQFGKVGTSRIDYTGSRVFSGDGDEQFFSGGGSNPDPAYYQKLPSYFLRFENNQDYQGAYLAQQEFLLDGQLNWESLYSANRNLSEIGSNASYVLYEDRNDDTQISGKSALRAEISRTTTLNAAISFRSLRSENFARILDLLGGDAFLDVDSFSDGDNAQSDRRNPNRMVGKNEKFKYHFLLDARTLEAFVQPQLKFRKYEFYLGTSVSYSEYQRTGLYKNGNFPDNSLGKSELQDFLNHGIKSGLTYKFSGRHLLDLNAGHFTTTPTLRNSFSNSRQNNDVVRDLQPEKIQSVDGSYILRAPRIKGRLSGYYTEMRDATEIAFYFADGISGLGRNATTAFVQEVLRGIGKLHLGSELGVEAEVVSGIKLKGVAALGRFTYNNDPGLYLTSSDFTDELHYGNSHIKNYRIAGGPQRAYQLGFEYRDPRYWWFSATSNYFSHAFVDVAPLTRTRNFLTDADGLPIINYDEDLVRFLLKQEQFKAYVLVNTVGGKSWRVKQNFIGVFASINNILNTDYRTGGFEQSRNANYRTLKADRERQQPIFASKYWFGPGTTYYSHVYVRF